jgi:hypothetical protein
MYQTYLEPVIKQYTTGEYYEELFKAKQEYFDRAGVVYEDDSEFESRMNIFLDWYLFDRELPSLDLPPIRIFFRNNRETLSPDDQKIYEDFCSTVHSIFELSKVGKDFVKVDDLFSKKSYQVQIDHLKQGFVKGDIFEARLIPFRGVFEFSNGFCFHPVEMEKFILGEIKKVRNQDKSRQTKLILQLAAMKLKHVRYQHINIKHIYSFNDKI